MKLFERFAAAFAVLTASNFEAVEGKPELTEENVEALEAAAQKLEAVEADNIQLKGDNQAHAERIAALEETVKDNATTVATIVNALEANNVDLAEGADLGAIVADKINAWGKTVPPATPVAASDADDLGDAQKADSHLSEIDKRARNKFKKRNK